MGSRSPNGRAKLETEKLFRSLFVHMGEGVALHEVITDDSGKPINYRILEVNPNYQAVTGLCPAQVVGKLATEAYGTAEPPYLREFGAVGMGAPPQHFESYFAPHDRHYEISVAPMGQGYFATIFMDVSDHKRQEQALRTKSDELDQFFRLAIDLLCIADVSGRFVRANAAWTSLGWTPEQLEGRSFLDFVHPDDVPATRAAMDELAAGKPVINFTNRYRASDDSYHFIEWRSAPAAGGHIYAAARDVTRRMQTEAALRAAEERLRRIFELVPTPLVLVQPDGVVLDCNQAFCLCTGYARDDLIGRSCTTTIGLDAHQDQRGELPGLLAGTARLGGIEVTIRRKDDQQRMLLLSARRIDVGGNPLLIVAGQDITEKRALERQMLHAQKLESLGVLAGGIAHDFNNLLTGILGNADLALRELSPLSPARGSLDDIGAAARRASELCRQLLAYSGKGRFVVQPLDLAELVREMGHLLALSIGKHATLHYHFGVELPAIDADATQIRQVLMNLIVNASEAMASRNGIIGLRTGMSCCDRDYLAACSCADDIEPGDFVFLEVSDTGQGMDRATLERIFDPFFTTKFTGRGLGLAAVLGIVRGHRGAIRVYSEPGRGTTFKLLFPPSTKQPHRQDRPNHASVWQGRGTVLLVDDEESVRKAARRMLEQAGFAVLVAEHGRAAVDLFREEKDRIAMTVLDLTMPELDGEACFRALRQLRSDAKVLLTSGYNEQEAVNAFAGRGLAGFLQKPFSTDELIAKVREILDNPPTVS